MLNDRASLIQILKTSSNHGVKYKLFTQLIREKVLIQIGKSIFEVSTKEMSNILTWCEREKNVEIFPTSCLSMEVARYVQKSELCGNIMNDKVEIGENERCNEILRWRWLQRVIVCLGISFSILSSICFLKYLFSSCHLSA
jgi:hypothetical protein